jgi:hypothetical protein
VNPVFNWVWNPWALGFLFFLCNILTTLLALGLEPSTNTTVQSIEPSSLYAFGVLFQSTGGSLGRLQAAVTSICQYTAVQYCVTGSSISYTPSGGSIVRILIRKDAGTAASNRINHGKTLLPFFASKFHRSKNKILHRRCLLSICTCSVTRQHANAGQLSVRNRLHHKGRGRRAAEALPRRARPG